MELFDRRAKSCVILALLWLHLKAAEVLHAHMSSTQGYGPNSSARPKCLSECGPVNAVGLTAKAAAQKSARDTALLCYSCVGYTQKFRFSANQEKHC